MVMQEQYDQFDRIKVYTLVERLQDYLVIGTK